MARESRNNKAPGKENQRNARDPNPKSDGKAPTLVSTTSPLSTGEHCDETGREGSKREMLSARLKDPNTYIALGTILLVIIGFGAFYVTRDSEIKQLGAFVTVNDLRRDDVLDKAGHIMNAHFAPVIENSGETAVRNGMYQFGFWFWYGADNFRSPTIPEQMKMTGGSTRISIGPRSKLEESLSNIGVTGDIIEALRSQTTALYTFGRIDYRDVFGYCHLTKFCFTVGRKGPGAAHDEIPINFCEGDTNCTDDECDDYRPC
jgi:hypothetical protein